MKFAAARRVLRNVAAVYDRRWICTALAALTALLGGAAKAGDPAPSGLQAFTFHGVPYLVHDVDPKKDDLQMFLKFNKGVYIHDFTGLQTYLDGKGEKLLFAANAGMFQPDFTPCGLLVLDGNQIAPLNTDDGQGNFYMKPNGVFLINQRHEAHIVNSADYVDELSPAAWATQSGPMLVLRGDINPDFNASSKSLKIRSGVGVRQDGLAVFALSRQPVSFYDFATLFRDRLKCPNALFLDGDISAFYVPGAKYNLPQTFGPMIGVVAKQNP
ncbi:MAG TPA: phosphodiester glycosidase family protein [Candidatus Methylacidiphilales bacterium]|nr:phosphodiester glycosidase family protein [Candidatus Methylacidiphilales bacterium]